MQVLLTLCPVEPEPSCNQHTGHVLQKFRLAPRLTPTALDAGSKTGDHAGTTHMPSTMVLYCAWLTAMSAETM